MNIPSGWRRYMEGYDARKIETGPGKYKIEYIYIGDYRTFDISGRQFVIMKLGYAMAAVILTVAYILAATLTTSSYRVNYVAIPVLITIVPVVYLLIGAGGYVLVPRMMTPRNYRSSVMITKWSSLAILLLMAAAAALHMAHVIRLGHSLAGQDMEFFLLCLLDVFLAAGIFAATFKIKIKTVFRNNQMIINKRPDM